MKKLLYIFLLTSLMAVVVLPSCKKVEIPEQMEVKLTNTHVDVVNNTDGTKTVTITGTFEYPGEVSAVYMYINNTESYSSGQKLGTEYNEDDKSITGVGTGNLSAGIYYYWVNFYNGFDDHHSEMKKFKIE